MGRRHLLSSMGATLLLHTTNLHMICELFSRLSVCAGHWCDHWRSCWHYGCQANLTSFRHVHGQTITGKFDVCIHPGTVTTWFHRCSCKHYPFSGLGSLQYESHALCAAPATSNRVGSASIACVDARWGVSSSGKYFRGWFTHVCPQCWLRSCRCQAHHHDNSCRLSSSTFRDVNPPKE